MYAMLESNLAEGHIYALHDFDQKVTRSFFSFGGTIAKFVHEALIYCLLGRGRHFLC